MWKDYENNSQLVLAFGYVSAKVDVLGRDAAGVENHFGITCHPYMVQEITDHNREYCKELAQAMLADIIIPAANKLRLLISEGSQE